MAGQRTQSKKNPEMKALDRIISTLEPLNPVSKNRILGYICDLYIEKNSKDNDALIAGSIPVGEPFTSHN